MELLTKELREALPPLYTNEDVPLKDQIVQIRFFHPGSYWVWYVVEGSAVDAEGLMDTDDPKVDFHFFGYVIGFEAEAGYFSLNELTENGVQRDTAFTPTRLGDLVSDLTI